MTASCSYDIKSTYILQPGPAALTDGVRQLHALLARVAGVEPDLISAGHSAVLHDDQAAAADGRDP